MNKKKISAFLIAAFIAVNSVSSFTTINVLAESNVIENRVAFLEEEISHSQMTASASSYEASDSPQNAIDGKTSTMWHTPWDGSTKLPQSLTLDLGGTNSISSINVIPRTTQSNGIITKYEVYAIKGDSEVKIASGKWEVNNLAKSIILNEAVSADKIKIVALEGVGNYASISEVKVYRSVGQAQKISSYTNQSINSDSTTVNITKDMESLKNLKEGTIVTRFDTNGTGIQSLFGVSNNKTNNGYFSLYVNNNRIGFELRTQSQEGNTTSGTTNLAHKYADVTLNKGINTVALKITNGVGYKIFVNGVLALDSPDTTANFLSAVQGANSAFVGKADRLAGNEYIFNGDIDFIDVYGEPISDNYLINRTGETVLYKEEEVIPDDIYKTEPKDIFYSGYLGSNNYRIPALLTTKKGTVLASIDARISNGNDSPNNIDTAIRRKVLNNDGKYGEWEEGKKIIDLPENASTIDTSLVQDQETERIFMLVTTYASGYGFPNSKLGSGYTTIEKDGVSYKYRSLYDRSNNLYTIRENGIVYDNNGNQTDYKVTENNMDLYKGENKVDNVMTSTSPLKVLGTSFLSLIYSDDDGVTWSDPVELNKEVKSDWMAFLGTGPGKGIQIKNGEHSGRLVFPVYLTNSAGFQSSALIYSDDKGESWKIGKTANDGRDLGNGQVGNAQTMTSGLQLTESQVVEMPNGQLKLFMRNTGADTRIATSFDGGATWDPEVYEDSNLKEPYCQLSVINYSKKIDGKDAVIFSNPDASSRFNGTVKIGLINQSGTHANGQPKYTFDWKYKKVVNPGAYAYSCLTELPDGNIGLFYEGTANTSMSYMEMGIDYIKYNAANSMEPAAIKSVTLMDGKEKYLPGDDIKFNVKFNQAVSLIGDKDLTVNIAGKNVALTLIPGENSNEFIFTGTLPNDIEVGNHNVILNANINTKILNTLGNELRLNNDINLNLVVNVESKEVSEVDKTFLGIVIDYAKYAKSNGALEGVIPAVVTEFEGALKEAETIFADSKSEESKVDLAEKRLTNAIWMLEFKKGDKAELIKLVEMINALDEGRYTTSTWDALEIELENANKVISDENAMVKEVSEAYDSLNKVFTDLELAADKDKLNGLVNNVESIDTSKYTAGTVDKFNSELSNAKDVLANNNAIQEQVNEAYNKLIKAYLDLRLIPDKSKLEELINKAESIELSKYTRASVDKFNVGLANVKTILGNEEASQKEVDEASIELASALDNLELAQAGTNNNVSTNNGGTTSKDNNNNSNAGINNSGRTSNGKSNTNSNLPKTGGTSSMVVGLFATITSLVGGFMMKRKK